MALAPWRLGPKHAALARALAGYGHGPLMHSLVHALTSRAVCTLRACTRAPHHVPALSGHRRRRDSSWRLLLCAAASAAPCLPATGEAFGAVIVAVDLSERGLHGKAAITNSTKQVFLRSLASAFVHPSRLQPRREPESNHLERPNMETELAHPTGQGTDFEDASLSGSSLWQYEVPRVPIRLTSRSCSEKLKPYG